MSKTIVKEFRVSVGYDPETKSKISECWTYGEDRHRLDDAPAIQEWNPRNGIMTYEAYLRFDGPHREGKPAIIRRHPLTGEVVGETWGVSGVIHRDGNKPAVWEKDPQTGVIITEEYWSCGERHRARGAAKIDRDSETGAIIRKEYYRRGKLLSSSGVDEPEALAP